MANENNCVFCGEKLGAFRRTTVQCGNTWQPACKDCEKELTGLSELELCQRAMVRGIANEPVRLKNRITLLTEAEDHRPVCDYCGNKLQYLPVQTLDNSPHREGIFSSSFEVLPACCTSCGKYTFYHPGIVRRNPFLAYLMDKDAEE